MSTKLATAAQLHHSLELSDSDREAAQAESTRRTYASAWQQFQTWADAGSQRPSHRLHRKSAGGDLPLPRLGRRPDHRGPGPDTRGPPAAQARPGGRMESPDIALRRANLYLAVIGVLADGGLRRSEASALTWRDVELWPDGAGGG